MKTLTKTINVYNYQDLLENEDLKRKVLDKLSDINVDYGWWEFIIEDAENVGIKITGFDTYRGTISGDNYLSYAEIKLKILSDHGKTCETYKTVKSYDLRKLGEGEDMFQMLLENYLSILKKEYEYRTSEKSILESIESNGYEFDENGNLL